ncbi:Actin cytoskeleton-regulatory complex protein [Actinidia chinensis var. chinensis]|uniref:Actin cytoskeleton-regulatory complex protein n=1 Tax=Actinidia chinensis var. chinensis TaxID=1590841 RepID=A0A2R6R5M6_ACTCC|nr:Actin cytoskeleton-regulatory complex protein [Actinidia chinensis var. chinensis]
MEWATLQHLDLRHPGRSSKPLQPHAAAFHPTQAIVATAVGNYITEFDVYTGSKIASIDIGSSVVQMAYSPVSGHTVIAILEDCTIRSCDFDSEQTCVLHSPEKRTEHISVDTEVHLALTPLQPIVFFGFHRRMTVTVVGTVEGGRAPTKIKTDLKKPIVNLACHPRHPLLYVAYADGLIRAYDIHSYAVHYTLQLDNTIKLLGAGAFAFHPTLEWIFVGDRRGTLLAWDVSTERPNMIGITQVGSQPIVSVAWLSTLRLLVTLCKDGALQVWKTRVMLNPNRPPMQANFFEAAAIESLDIPRILSQQGGEAVYPLPRIKSVEVHSKLNLAALLFANMTVGVENRKNRAVYTREGRKQLFAVLQSARGSSASVLKEKLSSLGSSGILADHQLQAQLQEQHLKGQSQLTISDIARKAFLYSHFMEEHARSSPISRLPLITILDTKHVLKDVPVCQPFHLELNFFNRENRVLHYPIRAFYLDGANLMAYNLCSGVDNVYKKLYTSIPGNVEFHPKYLLYSTKQHLFLVVYEFSGATTEVVLYWENTDSQSANSKTNTVKGLDAAFIGPNENQFAILDEDKTGLALYILPGGASLEVDKKNVADEQSQSADVNVGSVKGPLQFLFETEVDRIFSTPIESTLIFASHGDHIGLAKLVQGYRLSNGDGHYIPTKGEGKKTIKLKVNETVLQVSWQETLRGYVAGVLTTQRVLIVSEDLDVLASSFTKFDKGLPSFRSLLWVGPALLFSTTTAISMLGWDGKVRTILSISMPTAVLVGALNDRLLLANPTGVNPRQKKGVEIKSCLAGLLEPLLIGFATMQQNFEQKLDLSEVLYQITSRFDSLRISPRSLDILARGSPVCGDLAVSLSQAGPQFTQVLRGIYAINALRFSTALSVLKDEFLRSRDYPQCPPTSHLFHRFRQLGYACIKYGQFDSAKETFEVIADYESMLDLFICHLNPSAMRRLAQKLEEESADSELRRYCERILRVRSTGWTQGIFANFAAESMVPKGPEWGGGNWEIKTPTNLKSIPQWELATEVMPYMRTDDGSIPSILTDHIGVYLGLIKGRSNVVEVREGSLVKALKSDDMGMKANGLQAPLATSMSNNAKGVGDGSSLMGLETLTKQLTGPTAADEQAKAEEEFKKSLYSNADGSSSDEEGTSKAKKIHIRIRDKPVASATVDVNKIKEATKQFKLGEGLGLPMGRTKPSTSQSPDLGLIVPQPAPTITGSMTAPTVSAPADIFGTDSMVQPAPVSQPGPVIVGGVATGPIPEDFFQNTISSVKVAALLPPPGTYLSRMDQNSQGFESSKVAPKQLGVPVADVGLPDGGVPPQVTQSPVSLDSIGLPDGGVPPQPVAQLSALPVSQVQTAQVTVPTQPIDLSSLEPPGSANSGKPSTRPDSPKSVRPGQVPRGAAASVCFKTGLAHLEQNQLPDALSCFDEAFLALAKDQSRGSDIRAQATICAQYKIAVTLLQEIGRLQRVQGPSAISAKDEMARLSRHLGSLPLLAKHRINCIRTAIKRNMEVQNYAYSKQMLELLFSKAPSTKQDELRSLIDICVQRGSSNKSIDPLEDPSQFCAATLSRLSTIGYDVCDLCGAKFSALSTPGCIICGMGSIKRSDSLAVPVPSPFG